MPAVPIAAALLPADLDSSSCQRLVGVWGLVLLPLSGPLLRAHTVPCFRHPLGREWEYSCQPSTTGLVLVSLAAALILATILVYLLMRCAVLLLHAVHCLPCLNSPACLPTGCWGAIPVAPESEVQELPPRPYIAPITWPLAPRSIYAWKELRKRSYCHFKTNNMWAGIGRGYGQHGIGTSGTSCQDDSPFIGQSGKPLALLSSPPAWL